MELQRLVMEDALETPLSDDMSPQEVCGRSRQGSVCVNPTEEAALRSLSGRSLASEDSDASSVVYHKSLRGVMAGVGEGEGDDGCDEEKENEGKEENKEKEEETKEDNEENKEDTNKDGHNDENDNHNDNKTTPEVPVTTDTNKEEDTQPKTSPPRDETPAIPIDFTEDFTTLFRSRSSQSLETNPAVANAAETKTEMSDEKKAVSMSARILGVLGRKTEDDKKKKQKKKREGEEVAQEAKEEASVEETPEVDSGGKKKWEIDQRRSGDIVRGRRDGSDEADAEFAEAGKQQESSFWKGRSPCEEGRSPCEEGRSPCEEGRDSRKGRDPRKEGRNRGSETRKGWNGQRIGLSLVDHVLYPFVFFYSIFAVSSTKRIL